MVSVCRQIELNACIPLTQNRVSRGSVKFVDRLRQCQRRMQRHGVFESVFCSGKMQPDFRIQLFAPCCSSSNVSAKDAEKSWLA